MNYNCKPITQKAKSSPFKANEALIEGAGDVAKKYNYAAEAFAEGVDTAAGETKEKKK